MNPVGPEAAVPRAFGGESKKSYLWVNIEINILKHKLKQSKEFVEVVQMKGRIVLDQNIAMDKLAASMHSACSRNKAAVQVMVKRDSWASEGKSACHETTKTMVLAFFDSRGMVYTNYVPKGKSVNGNFIAGALRTFLKHSKKKMPEIVKE